MIRRPPRSTQSRSSAASDVYKRQTIDLASSRRPCKSHPPGCLLLYTQQPAQTHLQLQVIREVAATLHPNFSLRQVPKGLTNGSRAKALSLFQQFLGRKRVHSQILLYLLPWPSALLHGHHPTEFLEVAEQPIEYAAGILPLKIEFLN